MAHDRLIAEMGRSRSVGFDRFMELALYDPVDGFFSRGGGAGRRGDFITSVEVGPLFGAVLARALDQWWDELGQPEDFTVVDAGAGIGTLARTISAAGPRCSEATRFLLVERSDILRAAHPVGPRFESVAEWRSPQGHCVIVANELLDNLPVRIVERTASGWAEVRVALADGELVEVLEPTEESWPFDAKPGQRVPVQQGACDWLREAVDLVGSGRIVVFDYADETGSLARRDWRSWLRTYRGHERGADPLTDVGSQDITCEVAVDQLRGVLPPTRERSQREFLLEHGIESLVEEGRRIWEERAAIGDLQAVAARSRVNEAAALLDPAGLGGFATLEWALAPS